jgi:hypothetical protein
MSEKISQPTGSPNDIRIKRGITVGRSREEQPAMSQPTQKTVPGPNPSLPQ